MKKIGIILGAVVVAAVAYWLISPLFIERRVNESIDEIAPRTESDSTTGVPEGEDKKEVIEIVGRGMFSGLAGHNAEGTALLVNSGGKSYVRFDDDFKITNGPDVFVHLGKDGIYSPEANLGPIKGNVGGQNYEIPETIDESQYNEVWVWCRAFSVPFGSAQLK